MSDSPLHEATPSTEARSLLSDPAGADGAVPSFLPVPVRARHDGWTPERQRAFIEALAETMSPAAAARSVGMSEQGARALRRRSGAGGFSAAWTAALRTALRDQLASLAFDKVVNGTVERRFYHGECVSEERVHSEKLLLWLLDKGEKLLASGPEAGEADRFVADWDGWMDRLGNGELEGGYRIWRGYHRKLVTNFPPPPGFAGGWSGDLGEDSYERSLTDEELAAHKARVERRMAAGEAARLAYFGPEAQVAHRPGRSKRRN